MPLMVALVICPLSLNLEHNIGWGHRNEANGVLDNPEIGTSLVIWILCSVPMQYSKIYVLFNPFQDTFYILVRNVSVVQS